MSPWNVCGQCVPFCNVCVSLVLVVFMNCGPVCPVWSLRGYTEVWGLGVGRVLSQVQCVGAWGACACEGLLQGEGDSPALLGGTDI